MRRLRLARHLPTCVDPARPARDHHPGLHGGRDCLDCRLVLCVPQPDIDPELGLRRVESAAGRARRGQRS
jgi:hypothetical protein